MTQRTAFFARFNRIIYFAYFVVIVCAIVLFWFLYQENLKSRLDFLGVRLREQTQALNYIIRLRADAVSGFQTHARNFLDEYREIPHMLPDIFKDNASLDLFHVVEKPAQSTRFGMVFGKGKIGDIRESAKVDLLLALSLNHLFRIVKSNIATSVSLYFASANGIMNLYPWRPPAEAKELLNMTELFRFSSLNPTETPRATLYWSDVYHDQGSSEPRVSCEAPIFVDNKLRAIVGGDFTLESLRNFLAGIEHASGTLAVINDQGTILAMTKNAGFPEDKILKLIDFFPQDLTLENILSAPRKQMTRIGDYWVYQNRSRYAPWTVVYYVNVKEFSLGSLRHVAPSVIILVLFAFLLLLLGSNLISLEFINPTKRLVDFISSQAKGGQKEIKDLREPWFSWFQAVYNVFSQNRKLVGELEKHIHDLDKKVLERTKDVSAKNKELSKALYNLKKAQKKIIVQEKLAGLGALTAGIAHEIKNPLNYVINFSETTADFGNELKEFLKKIRTPNGPDIERLVDQINENLERIALHGKRADAIVRSMLMHARGGEDALQETDLNKLLEENVLLAISSFKQQGFIPLIKKDFDPALPHLKVYRQELSRVFLNIINNACYVLDKKKQDLGNTFEGAITLKTRHTEEGVQIRIRDNGSGLKKEQLSKIFDPFYTTKPAGGGTGLGLSLSHDIIVNQHHGSLTVESEAGTYAEFIIVLPLDEGGEP